MTQPTKIAVFFENVLGYVTSHGETPTFQQPAKKFSLDKPAVLRKLIPMKTIWLLIGLMTAIVVQAEPSAKPTIFVAPLDGDLRLHPLGVRKLLRLLSVRAGHAGGRCQRDAGRRARRDARRLGAQQLRDDRAGRVEQFDHRHLRVVGLAHRRPYGRRQDRPAEIGVDAAGVDDGATPEAMKDAL